MCSFTWCEHAEREIAWAEKSGVAIISGDDAAYPRNL